MECQKPRNEVLQDAYVKPDIIKTLKFTGSLEARTLGKDRPTNNANRKDL